MIDSICLALKVVLHVMVIFLSMCMWVFKASLLLTMRKDLLPRQLGQLNLHFLNNKSANDGVNMSFHISHAAIDNLKCYNSIGAITSENLKQTIILPHYDSL